MKTWKEFSQAYQDGSLFLMGKTELEEFLKASTQPPQGGSDSWRERNAQMAETLRHLISGAEIRENQQQMMRWMKVAAIAACIAALPVLWPAVHFLYRESASQSKKQTTERISPSPSAQATATPKSER
jgi:hypothetical protein